jgi:tRNA 2-selenouridine synthase
VNIALFSDAERAHVGTVYKQQSSDEAYKIGYEYVTPKMQYFIDEARKLSPDGKIVVHCWRGGMRSQSFAKHLSDNGFPDVYTIKGGYKSYRRSALSAFNKACHLNILGGYTGSGKTRILPLLKSAGFQVVDLEGIANHKGSAFGAIGQDNQPTTEQFENNLYEKWRELDVSQPIWLEDESQNIGRVNIPIDFFLQMRQSPVYFLDIPREERAKLLVDEYACQDSDQLESAIHRISKRLGGLDTQNALKSLAEKNFYEVALITLHYYDKTYYKGLTSRSEELIRVIEAPDTNSERNVELVINCYKK